jgi:hypothetical protein
MEYKVEKSEGFEKPLVPKAVYKAKFTGINKEIPKGEYGERIGFMYEIQEGEHKGNVLQTIANAKVTNKTRAGKMFKGMLGRDLKEGENIDPQTLIGKVFEILTETLKSDFGDYSVVSEVIREVKEGSK